jgi:ABC-type transporter Mla MlaB component
MIGNLYLRKKRLLEQMREETIGQLQALTVEDVQQFLNRVEKCEQIIVAVNHVDSQTVDFLPEQQEEIKKIVQEIISIRQQIAPLLTPLYNKLKKLALTQKQNEMIKRGYGEGSSYQASIFFDKKN